MPMKFERACGRPRSANRGPSRVVVPSRRRTVAASGTVEDAPRRQVGWAVARAICLTGSRSDELGGCHGFRVRSWIDLVSSAWGKPNSFGGLPGSSAGNPSGSPEQIGSGGRTVEESMRQRLDDALPAADRRASAGLFEAPAGEAPGGVSPAYGSRAAPASGCSNDFRAGSAASPRSHATARFRSVEQGLVVTGGQ